MDQATAPDARAAEEHSAATPTRPGSTTPATSGGESAAPPSDHRTPEESPTGAGSDGGEGKKPALSAALTLASVNDAFQSQLDAVSQKVRVRFKGGKVMGVEGATIIFGVPNPIHRDRCDDVKAEVEQAFSAHFGQPVSLDVRVDGDAAAPTMDPAPTPGPRTDLTDDEDVGPVEDLVDATEESTNGIDRLTKAFPGSTVVEQHPEPGR